MEAWLFFISIWCGIYGFVLRKTLSHKSLGKNIGTRMVFNGFFWATGAALGGMLVASYTENINRMPMYTLACAAVGFVLGMGRFFTKRSDEEGQDFILQDNLEWANTGFSAILLASVVMFFIVQAFKIPSGSMRMTFIEGDHLFVNKFIYGVPIPFTKKKIAPLKEVKQDDVVIFRFPSSDKENQHYGKDFIKRVIAIEGQRIQIVNKTVYVDGNPQEKEYKQHVDNNTYVPSFEMPPEIFQQKWEEGFFSGIGGNEVRDNFGPVTIPKGHVFVMGDNRDRSFDSRFWGPLPLNEIKGKALLLYWPLRRFHVIHR